MKLLAKPLIACVFSVGYSDIIISQSDTLYFEEFIQIVQENHPVISQANLNLKKGESTLRIAKGNFDPKIEATHSNKFYNQQEYYNTTSANVKFATPSPVSFKLGFDKNNGNYLNPENNTSKDGLLLAGVSMPVLQGLMTDERRTALRQANAFMEYSEWQRKIIVNDLLLSAYNQYFTWWAAYTKESVAKDVYLISQQRHLAFRERAKSGDLSMIDTLETFTQMQNRLQIYEELRGVTIKERMMLSSFLWNKKESENEAIVLGNGVAPSNTNSTLAFFPSLFDMTEALNSIEKSNPSLKQYESKFESLAAEESLKKEKLKPSFNVNYNFLSQSTSGVGDADFSPRNYKWGVDFGFPIFIRQARGDIQLTRIKIQENQFEYQQKTQEVKNKTVSIYENIQIVSNQINLVSQNQKNYFQLLEAEKEKFLNGESSVFLVNQREQQFAEARNKLIDLQLKLATLSNELQYQLGVIK